MNKNKIRKINKRAYSGSVVVNHEDRKYVIYKVGKKWAVSKIGGFGKVEIFNSKIEAEKNKN